ncbi:MAG: hypothetical protein EXR79_01265 [Myxococcales bacterium]|nr:hypothetical protein [Myxococcales bacterium]
MNTTHHLSSIALAVALAWALPAWALDDERAAPAHADAAVAASATGRRHGRSAGVLDARGRVYGSVATYAAKQGETLRTVAYRYCTSPVTVAMANNIAFDSGRDTVLVAGAKVKVPIAFKAPSGLPEAEQLLTGPGVRSERVESNWGRPHVVHLLRTAFRDLNRRWPGRHPAVLGSLSRPNGGKLGRHKSHRSGQDVDIGYLTRAANNDEWGRPRIDAIDYERMWALIDGLERTGQVAAIYMAPAIQRRLAVWALAHGESGDRVRMIFQYAPQGHGDSLVRFAAGHRDHFHVRFQCAEDFKVAGRDS